MSENPFNRYLDWSLQGKYVLAENPDGVVYTGWLNRIHHQRGSVLLHDARIEETDESVGSVFLRQTTRIHEVIASKQINKMDLKALKPNRLHNGDFEPKERIMRRAHRNQFTGGFPVVRKETNVIINGHKRVQAAKMVGMKHHPVELVSCTDEQATELFYLSHEDHERTDFEWCGDS